MQTELLGKIERITKLVNLIKAEMDDRFINVSIDYSFPGLKIFLAKHLKPMTGEFDCDYFIEAFPDYEVTDHGKLHNKLSVIRDGVEIMILEDKEEVNEE